MNYLLFPLVGAIFLLISGTAAKVQPWPIKVERTGVCCGHSSSDYRAINQFNAEEVHGLATCLDEQKNLYINTSAVSIVTFSSSGVGAFSIPDMNEFAVYQRALIAAYAENNKYVYKHVALGTDHETFEKEVDARWLKVKILLDALNGWAKDTRWIVWIDADAVVLDFGLDVEELGQRNPQADFLASADIRMGLVNTGTLVLRNTPWLRSFLTQWWYGPGGSERAGDIAASRQWRSVCDQDAFDRLYSHYSRNLAESAPRIGDKVKVLAMDAINSHPPAAVHQRAENAVLHLMGEGTAMRRELFRRAWGSVCAARSGGVLAPQLSLNRDILLLYARSIYSEATQVQLRAAQNASLSLIVEHAFSLMDEAVTGSEVSEERALEAALVQPLEDLSRTAHHLCDVLRHLHSASPTTGTQYQYEALVLRKGIFNLTRQRAEEVQVVVASLSASLASTRASLQASDPAGNPHVGELDDRDAAGVRLMLLAADMARKRRSLMSVQVQLLKRAAEAGNDLFGAEPHPVEKLRVAQAVLGILDDLEAQVDEQSKYVPMHMRALMHQSLGVMEQALAALEVRGERSQQVSSREVHAAHLREAYKHAATSASTFAAIRSRWQMDLDDSSYLMEESASLQLLGGVTCSLGRHREARRRWEDAIEHARRSLKGIERGVRYDNLAVVLYNAALCYSASGQAADADLLLAEALRVIDGNSVETSQSGGALTPAAPARGGDRALRARVEQLRASVSNSVSPAAVAKESPTSQDWTLSGESDTGVMRPIIDPTTGKVSYVRKSTDPGPNADGPTALSDGLKVQQDEEWEECELDEPCEEFIVETFEKGEHVDLEAELSSSFPPVKPKPVDQLTVDPVAVDPVAVDPLAVDPLTGVDVQGMTAEDVAELREIRRRYARQHSKQAEVANLGTSSTGANFLLATITSQLAALQAVHTQQGRIIEQMVQEIEMLKARV